eukprot:TRINITY_DN4331_c0_g2_i11.p1 TRINITY_DN4331_c0_g2~~TRINITY_DN4331_c0_g2_i11.p1  ORF type:complete len:466 (+),score=78.30 TRINITY_DN4331_c0_g2_i11:245-1642(+)
MRHDFLTCYRVIVMGKTNSGKSSLLNSLTATTHFKIGGGESKKIEMYTGKFKRRFTSPDITFVDTPGFFDHFSDSKIVEEIVESVNELGEGSNLLLFCFPAYDLHTEASLHSSHNFLKLLISKLNYQHLIIVLTHGDKLNAQEFERAIARMTTEFIPRLREGLRVRMKEEVFVYRKGEEQDGLDGVFGCLVGCEESKKVAPVGCADYLLQNSEIFNNVQDLLLGMQGESRSTQNQIEEIKQKIKKLQENETKAIIKELQASMEEKFREEKASLNEFKSEIKKEIDSFKQELANKDKEISELKDKLAELSKRTPMKPRHNTAKKDEKENAKVAYKNTYESPNAYRTATAQPSSIAQYHISPATESFSKTRLTTLVNSIESMSKPRMIASSLTASNTKNTNNSNVDKILHISRQQKRYPISPSNPYTLLKPEQPLKSRRCLYFDKLPGYISVEESVLHKLIKHCFID